MRLFCEPEQSVLIPGECGAIEACCHAVKREVASDAIAVVCHPHPQFGGTMDNKVVTTLVRSYLKCGMNAVRFNFRGVGRSAGSFDDTRGEFQDLSSVVSWLKEQVGCSQFYLAGFSFGSFIAYRGAVEIAGVEHLVLIAPPIDKYVFDEYMLPKCPIIVVQGEADEVVEPSSVYQWCDRNGLLTELSTIKNAGHFFHGQLIELRNLLIPKIEHTIKR